MDNMAPKKLGSITGLFKKSFDIYMGNIWVLVKLMLLSFVVFLVMAPVWVAFGLTMVWGSIWWAMTLFIFAALVILAAMLVGFWAQVSLLYVIRDRATGITAKQALAQGWKALTPLAWIYLLVGLAVLGGFILLVIPGIIFAVWFLFSKYVYVAEGTRGTAALKASKQLVKGYWWAVLGRLVPMVLLSVIISSIPFLGNLINLFFMVPFATIYMYVMYEELKAAKS